MTARMEIVPALPAHVRSIAKRMRKADVDEVFASSGKSPVQALTFSLRKSAHAWTWIVDGRPEAMAGVVDLNVLTGAASPWLLGTDVIEEHPVWFLRQSASWRSQLLARYASLTGYVDDRHRVSISWLGWLGFRFSDPVAYRGHSFRLFQMRSDDVRADNDLDGGGNAAKRRRANRQRASDVAGRKA